MANSEMPAKSPNELENTLRQQVDGEIHFDRLTRLLYSTDASMYQIIPVAVVVPRSVDAVVTTVKIAAHFNMPVLARGSGSSLAGQTVAHAIVIDFTKYLDSILEIDAVRKTARVQPGVVLDDLNAAASQHGLMVGPDPASSNRATLGGMVANNATGTHSILYGNVVRHVRSINVVLADGSTATFKDVDSGGWKAKAELNSLEGKIYKGIGGLIDKSDLPIRNGTSSHWRRNSGYRLEELLDRPQKNLSHLICGSEGTLAVVTEIEISLVEKPLTTGLAVVHFATRREALEAVTTILTTNPSAIELFDGVTIRQCRQMAGIAERMTYVEGDPGAILFTEYYGSTSQDIERAFVRLDSALTEKRQGYATVKLTDTGSIDSAWSVRKEALGFIMGVRGDFQPLAFIEDASVPVDHLADYIDDLDEFISSSNTKVVYYAHASGGCLHVRPFINLKEKSEIDKMYAIAEHSLDLVRKYGGSFSSEHGDGLARSEFNERLVGAELYSLYRQTKQIFDPKNILNPGKIVDAPSMKENLRYGVQYNVAPVPSVLDFSEDGGFSRAIEQCSGVGTCRKLKAGTMCPSFMVTRDEVHSTRGRANALRSALAGDLDQSMTSDEMYGVMDLCIQCKACKTECPSNVDMAKIKSEWLRHYWRDRKVPLRTRMIANLPALAARIPDSLRSTVAKMSGSRALGTMMKRALGMTPSRALPTFASKTFRRQFVAESDRQGPPVALFVDTFTNYHHPEVGIAAQELLESVGYSVFLPVGNYCCGRTYMSKGFVERAQRELLNSIEALYAFASSDIPVVVLEPSCLSMITDDYKGLLSGEVRARRVASMAMSLEQVVAKDSHGFFAAARWKPDAKRYLIHGHCHQKALEGTAWIVRSMSVPTNSTVSLVDSGCCGMAGSFGYEAEHDGVSRKMANRVLVPAINATSQETVVVAPGTSCRAQINDLTGRKALHPAQALRGALDV